MNSLRLATVRAWFLFGLALSVAIPHACGGVAWDERDNGPLSASGLNPTPLSLSTGSNTIFSVFGASSQFDYFTFTVAAGQSLNGFDLDSYVSPDAVAWLGIKSGTDWAIEYDTTQMLAQQHFGTANIGTSLLGISGVNPLGPGTYTVRSQQLGVTADYQLNLSVVPEPSTFALLLGTGTAALLWRGLRHRSARTLAITSPASATPHR